MNEIGELIRDHSKGEINWKTFSIFLVGVMICTIALPQSKNLMPLKAGGMFPSFTSKLGKLFHPIFQQNLTDLGNNDKAKSVVLAEKICNKFCQSYESQNVKAGLQVAARLHTVADEVNYPFSIISEINFFQIYSPKQGEETAVESPQQEDYSIPTPHSKEQLIIPNSNTYYNTVYCNNALKFGEDKISTFNFEGDDKDYIHLVIPNKGTDGEMVKDQPQEYIGVFAKIVGSRKIKLGQAEPIIVQ